jgi:hypothetical protein
MNHFFLRNIIIQATNHWIQAFFRHGVGNWKSKGTSNTCFLPTFLPFALGSTFEYTGYNVPADESSELTQPVWPVPTTIL